jgi:hypothetical protein
MMTEMDIETSVYYVHLTRLIAREDFIKLTTSVAHPASYPVGIFSGGKSVGCEADHPTSCSAEVRNAGIILPLPQYIFMVWCGVVLS